MARIFSIFFDHDGYSHTALVSVRETGMQTEYVLNGLQESLQLQLPSNKLILDESGNLVFIHGQMQQPSLLMQAISAAVLCHLNAIKHQQRPLET